MKDTESSVDVLAIAREYTLRLHHANSCGQKAMAMLESWKAPRLTVDQIIDLIDEILFAEKVARRGIKHSLLTDITNAHGIHVAADAVIRSYELQGMKFQCRTVPDCSNGRICAMNNLIDRMIDEGYAPTQGMVVHYPVPHNAKADGCPKMDSYDALLERERRVQGALADNGRWTEDTASVHRGR